MQRDTPGIQRRRDTGAERGARSLNEHDIDDVPRGLCVSAPTADAMPDSLLAAWKIPGARSPERNNNDRLSSATSPVISPTKGTTMNWDIIEGNWKQFKGLVREKWSRLTDDNLDTIAGKRDQLAGKVQEAYGITKDQAEVQIKAFEQTHKDYQPKTPA